jgi:hypothetical protein
MPPNINDSRVGCVHTSLDTTAAINGLHFVIVATANDWNDVSAERLTKV